MNTTTWRSAAGLTLLAGLWAGCSEAITEVGFEDWSPEIAAPLLDTRFTLRDALAGSDLAGRVTEDEDSALRITVVEDLFDVSAASAFEVPTFAVPLTDVSTTLDFGDLGVDLPVTRVDLTGGKLFFRFRNDYPLPAQVTVRTSNFLIDGAPMVHTLTVPAHATTDDSVAVAAVSFRADDGDRVTVAYEANLVGGATGVRLTAGFFAVRARDYTYAEGNLKGLTLDLGTDSIDLDLLSDFQAGSVELIAPRATLEIDNAVGAPITIRTTQSFARTRSGGVIAIESDLEAGVAVGFPRLGEGPVSKRTDVVFDRETSNLPQLVAQFPSRIAIGVAATVNPEGRDETYFLHRDAFVRGRLRVDVPLAMRFDGFEVGERFDLDAGALSEAQSVSFLLRVDNGFNLDATAQVEFFDGAGASLGMLFDEPQAVLAAAVTNHRGATTAPTETTLEIAIAGRRLGEIAQARSARFVLRLQTPVPTPSNPGFTQLYYDSAIGVKLGTKVTLKPR